MAWSKNTKDTNAWSKNTKDWFQRTFLLQENTDFLLLENNDKIIIEPDGGWDITPKDI